MSHLNIDLGDPQNVNPYHRYSRPRTVERLLQVLASFHTLQYENGHDAAHEQIPPEMKTTRRGEARRALVPMSHPLPKLVQLACNSFRRPGERRNRQDRARKSMHALMIRWLTGSKRGNPREFSDWNLEKFAKYADTYFFMGTIFGRHWRRRYTALGNWETRMWIIGIGDGKRSILSHTFKNSRGHVYMCVNVRAFRNQPLDMRPLFPLITTILHELCHVYLMSYGCYCTDECTKEIPRWHGFSHHGMCWVTLFGMVVREIREWDPRLAEFGHGVNTYYVSAGDVQKETEEREVMFDNEDQRPNYLDVEMMDHEEYTYGTYEENRRIRVFERRAIPIQPNQENQPDPPDDSDDPDEPRPAPRRKRRREVDILLEEAERFLGKEFLEKRRRMG